MMLRIAALFSILICSTGWAVGQSTWVVDALNGPGTHFTNLPPAVAASSPGDVILIRYVPPTVAIYDGAQIWHGLTIAGIGGKAPIQGVLRVDLLPADQHLILRDLHMGPFTGAGTAGNGQIHSFDNQGSVHLQGILRDTTNAPGLVWWNFVNTELVTLTNCEFHTLSLYHAVTFRNCDLVTLHGCRFEQAFGGSSTYSIENSRVVMLNSELLGQPPGGLLSGSTPLQITDSTLEVGGTSNIDSGSLTPILASGTNQIRVGPNASVGATTAPWLPGTVTTMGAYIDPTGLLQIDVVGAPNGLGVLSLGEPSNAPVPLFGDTYFLDVPSVVVFGLALLDNNGAGSFQATFQPTVPSGLNLWLQSVVLSPNFAFQLTTPSVVTSP